VVIRNARTSRVSDTYQTPACKLADQVRPDGGADTNFPVLLRIVFQSVEFLKGLLQDDQFLLAPFENRSASVTKCRNQSSWMIGAVST